MRLLAGLSLLAATFPPQISGKSAGSTPGTPGIKMTIQFTDGQTEDEKRLYIQADRRRTECRNAFKAVHGDGTLDTRPGPRLASITRCDLGQALELNLDDREYGAASFPRFKPTEQQVEETEEQTDNTMPKVAPWVPTLRSEAKTVDTGERRNFFGHEARHVITTWKQTPQAGSHSEPRETVGDAWYIDLDMNISCESRWQPHNVEPRREFDTAAGERLEVIDDGIRVTGFAIESNYTSRAMVKLPDGTKRETVNTSQQKVTEFYEGPLDPALYEVPGDFRTLRDLGTEPPMTLADRSYFTSTWVKSLFHDLL